MLEVSFLFDDLTSITLLDGNAFEVKPDLDDLPLKIIIKWFL